MRHQRLLKGKPELEDRCKSRVDKEPVNQLGAASSFFSGGTHKKDTGPIYESI